MEKMRLKVNMILNGTFVRAGSIMDKSDIPLRLRKEAYIEPPHNEGPEEMEQEIEPEETPPPRRRILRRR